MNKITCICLGVRDMAKSLRFYRDGLGYKTDCQEDNPAVCFFDTPGTKFELYQVIALAREAGATILKEPQPVFWGGYHAYFSDPDGYVWEVAWGPNFQYDEQGLLKF